MNSDHWHRIVMAYADGRRICNCGEAYYDKEGRCEHGCQANLLQCKYEIAKKLCEDYF